MLPGVISDPSASGRTVHTCVVQLLERSPGPGELAALADALSDTLHDRALRAGPGVLLVAEALAMVTERLREHGADRRAYLAVIPGGVTV